MDFPQKLKKVMVDKGINQTELSRLTGIGKSLISQYLSGKFEPKQLHKEKIETVLDVSFEDKKQLQAKDELFKFSTKKITIKQAAKVMHMSHITLADELEQGKHDFGYMHSKDEKSGKRNFYISPKKFYEYTGWCY